jgi:tRNA threonylcarbamoyladenosine biosynthesis protein TsaE
MDLYRLKNEQEAINAGVEDALYSGNTCFVEWPEKAPGVFPDNTAHCHLTIEPNGQRKLQIIS